MIESYLSDLHLDNKNVPSGELATLELEFVRPLTTGQFDCEDDLIKGLTTRISKMS